MDQFKALGCSILAISTDSKFAHFAWSSQPTNVGGVNGIRYPLCADKNYMISREYGVMNEDEGTSHRFLTTIFFAAPEIKTTEVAPTNITMSDSCNS